MRDEQAPSYLDRLEELAGRFARIYHSRLELTGDISPSQYLLLRCLDQGERRTVSELAQMLGMTVPGATSLLDRLARQRWVSRQRDRKDRRIIRVSLTPEGQETVNRARARRRAIMAEMMAALEPAEVQQLLHLYEKITSRFADPQTDTRES